MNTASVLVTLPHNVTPYRDSVNGARDRVTYQKLVTRSRAPFTLSRYGVTLCGNVTSVDAPLVALLKWMQMETAKVADVRTTEIRSHSSQDSLCC